MLTEEAGFDRSRRLLTAKQFGRVFEKASRSSDDCFTILYRSSGEAYPRLGLAISKKALKRAVDRNRVKRVVRESFRRNVSKLPPVDLVVMLRRGVSVADNRELFRRLERHWARISRKMRTSGEADR